MKQSEKKDAGKEEVKPGKFFPERVYVSTETFYRSVGFVSEHEIAHTDLESAVPSGGDEIEVGIYQLVRTTKCKKVTSVQVILTETA